MIQNKKEYVEVLEILHNIPKEEFSLIPKDVIEYLEKNKDTKYEFKYNKKENNLSKEASSILVDLYMNYISTPDVKEKIEEILKLNEKL